MRTTQHMSDPVRSNLEEYAYNRYKDELEWLYEEIKEHQAYAKELEAKIEELS